MDVTPRTAAHPIEPMILDRWSPRSFDGSAIGDDELKSLFEAARWAPSSMNAQPWRFLYFRRDTPAWERFIGILMPFNQMWAKNASAGFLLLSETMLPGAPGAERRPSHSHSLDAGAAWGYLALQAAQQGLATHGMTGVDFAAAREAFAIPEDLRIECAVVIGRRAPVEQLPERFRDREKPSDRKPIDTFAFEGALTPAPAEA